MKKTTPRQYATRPRILVTGGAGFIGSHLCERLIEGGADVLCVDNFFTGTKDNISHLMGNPHFELQRHDVTFQCTRGLPTPVAAFDTTAPGTTTGGVINGLQYTLTAPAGSKTTTGTAATAASIGSADVWTYTFDGTIPAGQAGDPTQTPGPVVRTLTITY